ncbi:MAG: restriction endonuclease PLD domain-containing protein [Candidatus Shapirobacteria bacterium]|jgi:hypothetical protein
MLWNNVDTLGGDFINQVDTEFGDALGVTIASGYVSLDIINKYYSNFQTISQNGGSSRLLVGMAFYEGLSANKLSLLTSLNNQLKQTNENNGVFVSYNGKFHGKIYQFDKDAGKSYYLGSSNFSRSGLSGNIECTASISDSDTQSRLSTFIGYLFLPENAIHIDKAEIVVPGSSEYRQKMAITLDDLEKYDPATVDKSILPIFEFPLSRIANKEKSNLNAYFGKGRWSRATGKIVPRPWYEVELIADSSVRGTPLYPRGDFKAYTDDGYIIPMVTNGDYDKNIRSKSNLKILGQWIKNKLQKSGALLPLMPVTQDTLDAYGRSSINFYKIRDGKYYMEF